MGWIFLVVFWLMCAVLGGMVAESKEAASTGKWLGLICGPLGLFAAAFIDYRRPCPMCGTRLSGEPRICPGCRTEFNRDIKTPVY
jgi:hypothetical protein